MTNLEQATAGEPSADVFDMDRPRAPAQQNAAANDQRNQPQDSAPVPMTLRVKPWHFGCAFVVGAGLWISWPYLLPDEVVASKPSARLMLPGAMAPATQDVAQQVVAQQTAPAPAAPTYQQVVAPPIEEVAHPSANGPLIFTTQQASKPVARVRPSRTLHDGGRALTQKTPTEASGERKVPKYSINTVYAGQAWIQDGERTYVVKAGDIVDGITIISIDAHERRVVTSHGLIR